MVKKITGHSTKFFMFLLLSVILIELLTGVIPSQARSSNEGVALNEATQLIRESAHATDRAWEEFHAAAIEGTLASPLIQVTIENQLHEARHLLMQSQIANRAQEYQRVKDITRRIQKITYNIIQASRERKQ